jgi:hypothetical protein
MSERGFPVQDPSALTTAQLLREITSLKDVLGVRLNGIEKANDVFAENINRFPTATEKAVTTLRELVDSRFSEVYTTIQDQGALINEKLEGIHAQFGLRDKAVKETSDLNSTALQAALAASEKSSNRQTEWFAASQLKLENTFTKQLDQMAETVKTLNNNLTDKVNTVKESLNLIAGSSSGRNALWGWIAGGIGLLFSFVMVVIAVLVFLSHSNATAVAPIVIPK